MGFNIAPVSYLTIYLDATAVIICIGLIVLAAKPIDGRDKNYELLFGGMLLAIIINGITNAISYACHYQALGWSAPLRMICPGIAELSILYICFLWMLYVDYKLYSSWDRILRKYRYFQIPLFAFTILSVINLFTGILFTVDENMVFIWKTGYYILCIAQYFYGLYPVFLMIRHRLTHKRIPFFHIWPTVVPVLAASIFTSLSPYSARCLGFTIAVVFLYFSYVESWRFNDEKSGFLNSHYMDYILELDEERLPDYRSAINIYAENANTGLFSILSGDLPYGGELIRMSHNRFLIFSESGQSSAVKLFAGMLCDEAQEYDKAHPEEPPVNIIVSYTVRDKDETIKEFIKTQE